jgi:hypothetical protein
VTSGPPKESAVKWIIGIVVAIGAAVIWRGLSGSGRGRRRIPTGDELEVEIRRLEGELEQAESRGDKAAVDELTLQLRVQRHWLNKVSDPSWKDYYEQTGEKRLDEWGKTGAK